jgi:septum formation protein
VAGTGLKRRISAQVAVRAEIARQNKQWIFTGFPMALVLASTSAIRLQLLQSAGVTVEVAAPRVDEATVRQALQAEGAKARDIADALAELKARKISEKRPGDLVLGCDQVADIDGRLLAKPETPDEARDQLHALRGTSHKLFSAVVAYENAKPVWRHVAEARLTMHHMSDGYLDDYVARNWDSIRHSVGCYKIEEEGVRLFSAISGDHFTILGLPLLPLLAWLGTRGMIAR